MKYANTPSLTQALQARQIWIEVHRPVANRRPTMRTVNLSFRTAMAAAIARANEAHSMSTALLRLRVLDLSRAMACPTKSWRRSIRA
jgi:hypothetical protein